MNIFGKWTHDLGCVDLMDIRINDQCQDHKRNQEGDKGDPWAPRRSQICHWKVPNLTSEGPKLYLRSNTGF